MRVIQFDTTRVIDAADSVERGRASRLVSNGTRVKAGFTLFEMGAVVLIIGILSMVAIPDLRSGAVEDVDLAAARVANAVRFARSAATRSGDTYGVTITGSPLRVRVYRGDEGTSPPTPVYDVLDPRTKGLYDVVLDRSALGADLSLGGTSSWSASCTTPGQIAFAGTSAARCQGDWSVMLANADIQVGLDGHTRSVSIDGITGRVTVE